MKSIKSLKNLKGKRVLVRVDFNVPIIDGQVSDDFRLKKALPTIKFLKSQKAKVILLSHLGEKGTETLLPVAERLAKYIKCEFIKDIDGELAREKISNMKNGDVVLLENVRLNPSEVSNFVPFDRSLASLADIYVNEAFSCSHRKHASIVGVSKHLPHYSGIQFELEIKNLNKALHPKHPFLFILGGAKFETKLPLLEKYLKLADHVFVGGALANNFFLEQGFQVGQSLVEEGDFKLSKVMKNKKLILPIDVLVKNEFGTTLKSATHVLRDEKIVDIGEKSIQALYPIIKKSKFIIWNGPMGQYEDGYTDATTMLLKEIGKSKGVTILGGGDTVNLVDKLKMEKKFTFVSTGGGATLDFLAYGTLPGIEALK